MALHPLKLPGIAAHLFRIIAMQKRLLKALANPALDPAVVDTAWVQNVWRRIDPEWVRKFCLRQQEARIRAIAEATITARNQLYLEFCRQNKVPKTIVAGGDFRNLRSLSGFDEALARTVTDFFLDCYDLLGQSSRTEGYLLPNGRLLTKRIYNEAFRRSFPCKIVCPYCDGEIGTADLDHYYCKSHFPLLACSPWNLIPICKSCNDTTLAKGDRIALTLGPPRNTTDWLHPFHCPASNRVEIRLTGIPEQSVPELYSSDPAEQRRLRNHVWLMDHLDKPQPFRYLSKRWTNTASAFYDVLVGEVNRKASATHPIMSLVQTRLEDILANRGQEPSCLVRAAVCQAIVARRPEYLEEFGTPNKVALA
jgi:hypothetical protein